MAERKRARRLEADKGDPKGWLPSVIRREKVPWVSARDAVHLLFSMGRKSHQHMWCLNFTRIRQTIAVFTCRVGAEKIYRERRHTILASLPNTTDLADLADARSLLFTLRKTGLLWDKDFALQFVAAPAYFNALICFSGGLNNDVDVVKAALQDYDCSMEYASPSLRDSRDMAIYALYEQPYNLKYLSTRLCKNEDICLLALQQCTGGEEEEIITFIDTSLIQSRPFLLKVFALRGSLLRYFSHTSVPMDEELILTAVKSDPYAIDSARLYALGCPSLFAEQAMKGGIKDLFYHAPEYSDEPDVVRVALRKGCAELCRVGQSLQSNREIVRIAVQHRPNGFRDAYRFWNDKEMALFCHSSEP